MSDPTSEYVRDQLNTALTALENAVREMDAKPPYTPEAVKTYEFTARAQKCLRVAISYLPPDARVKR